MIVRPEFIQSGLKAGVLGQIRWLSTRWPAFNSQAPHGGRRELSPANCLLTSHTHFSLWVCTCAHKPHVHMRSLSLSLSKMNKTWSPAWPRSVEVCLLSPGCSARKYCSKLRIGMLPHWSNRTPNPKKCYEFLVLSHPTSFLSQFVSLELKSAESFLTPQLSEGKHPVSVPGPSPGNAHWTGPASSLQCLWPR